MLLLIVSPTYTRCASYIYCIYPKYFNRNFVSDPLLLILIKGTSGKETDEEIKAFNQDFLL